MRLCDYLCGRIRKQAGHTGQAQPPNMAGFSVKPSRFISYKRNSLEWLTESRSRLSDDPEGPAGFTLRYRTCSTVRGPVNPGPTAQESLTDDITDTHLASYPASLVVQPRGASGRNVPRSTALQWSWNTQTGRGVLDEPMHRSGRCANKQRDLNYRCIVDMFAGAFAGELSFQSRERHLLHRQLACATIRRRMTMDS
jgi:hypothetical protein